jgi:hypothetical protein
MNNAGLGPGKIGPLKPRLSSKHVSESHQGPVEHKRMANYDDCRPSLHSFDC